MADDKGICCKSPETRRYSLILVKNRDKLVTYLRNFHNDKDADAQFAEEKALVVETLLSLDAIER